MAIAVDPSERTLTGKEEAVGRNVEEAVAPPKPSEADGSPGRGRVTPKIIVLAIAFVVLTVTAIGFAVTTVGGFVAESGRADALAVAEQTATELTSFDFTSAQSDAERLWDSVTPNFQRSFSDDQASFMKMVQTSKLKVAGKVTGTGLYGYTDRETHALVAVKAQVQNAETPTAQERDYRMDLTLVHQDGRWLVDAAQFIS